MQSTSSFAGMLRTIARGSTEHRRELSFLSGAAKDLFVRDYVANLQVDGSVREDVEASSSAAATLRALWGAVPEKLFTSANPDFESLAEMACRRCGDGLGDDSVRDVATVFRRIRLHYEDARHGRAPLRSRALTLRRLLKSQGDRCVLCGFHFGDDVIADSEYEGDLECVRTRRVLDCEVAVGVCDREGQLWSQMARRPEVDHIIPLFLGGDGTDNLQVLCRVCNQGKGEDVLGPGLHLFSASNRPSDHRSVSVRKRFLVLARHAMRHGCSDSGKERRLFLENRSFLPTYGNIRVSDTECGSGVAVG